MGAFKIESSAEDGPSRCIRLVTVVAFAALLPALAYYASSTASGRAISLHLGGLVASAVTAAPADAAAAISPSAAAAVASSRLAPASWEGSYNFTLSQQDRQQALVSRGGMAARARRALHKLAAGLPIRMAFLGGSITQGHGSSEYGKTDFVTTVFDWIRKAFPHPDHQLTNGAVAGVGSLYFALCSEWHMPENPDLVVLEFNINDGGEARGGPIRRAHERLIRKLLNLPSRPAVVELSFMHYQQPEWWDMDSPFRFGGEDELMVFAEFYHMPLLSVRTMEWGNVIQTAMDPKSPEADRLRDMWGPEVDGRMDMAHPHHKGHKYMADLVVHFIFDVLSGLHREPLAAIDEEWANKPLSNPLYKNNWEAKTLHTCLMAQMVDELVVAKDEGWALVNEGNEHKAKWGYVSSTVGSSLTLKVNNLLSESVKPGENVTMLIAYLESYEHMGKFHLTCVEGCTCDPFIRNTHELSTPNGPKVSVMRQASMLVSAAESCLFKLTVREETTSDGHKVKLLGVILSEVQDIGGWGMQVQDKDVAIGIAYGQGNDSKAARNEGQD